MITFLNALLLTALAAAAIPILIHLLNRQKSRLVPFSTLEFLKVLQKKKMKRVKLRQILLLILRTLILILIVLAFARPTLTGYLSSGITAHSPTSVAIVLDNTLSTAARESDGIVFEKAKRKAREMIGFLKEGDDAVVILPSDPAKTLTPVLTANFPELAIMAQDLGASYSATDIPSAIEQAVEILDESRLLNREILVVTDMQESAFGATSRPIDLKGSRLHFIEASSGFPANVAVSDVEVKTRIIRKNKPVTVNARVKNFSDESFTEMLVQVYLDGKRAGQATVDLEEDQEKLVSFRIVPGRNGFIRGRVEIEDDALLFDNRRFFNLYAPEKIRVLLVGPATDTRFTALALAPAGGTETSITVDERPVSQMNTTSFTDYDVVIFSNVPRFDDTDVSRMKDYLSSGGGVLFLPGQAVDVNNYNQNILATFDFPEFSGSFGSPGDNENFLSFGTIDFDHPIFNGMFETDEKKVDSPKFYYSLIAGKMNGSKSSTIINLSNDRTFLEESRYDRGKILLATSSVDFDWSNLAVKGIFVPLMNRIVYYLAAKSDLGGLETPVGKNIEFPLERIDITEDLTVTTPDETEVFVKPRIAGSTLLFSFNETELPGTYQVENDKRIVNCFSVNTVSKESDLRRVSDERLEEMFGEADYSVIGSDRDLEEFILQSRYGKELWKFAVILAIILMITEMLIARERKSVDREEDPASS